MNLLDIYNLLLKGDITHKQAADTFGLTERDLKARITRHGHRLPLILSVLDKIKTDKITREEASKALERSTRQTNKLMESWKIERPLKVYLVDKQVTQIKWEIQKKYAIDFIAGGIDFETAAEGADLSTRQIRRRVADLLMKHHEMPYKDLDQLSMARRRRLAEGIETAENLELSKQNMLKLIADGKLSIKEEALNRVLSRRVVHDRRKNTNI